MQISDYLEKIIADMDWKDRNKDIKKEQLFRSCILIKKKKTDPILSEAHAVLLSPQSHTGTISISTELYYIQ